MLRPFLGAMELPDLTEPIFKGKNATCRVERKTGELFLCQIFRLGYTIGQKEPLTCDAAIFDFFAQIELRQGGRIHSMWPPPVIAKLLTIHRMCLQERLTVWPKTWKIRCPHIVNAAKAANTDEIRILGDGRR